MTYVLPIATSSSTFPPRSAESCGSRWAVLAVRPHPSFSVYQLVVPAILTGADGGLGLVDVTIWISFDGSMAPIATLGIATAAS